MGGKGTKECDRLIFVKLPRTSYYIFIRFLCGLKQFQGLNIEKSKLISIRRVPIMKELMDILRSKIGPPSKYLGLLVGVVFKSTTIWDFVEERVQRKLARWKR